MGNLFLICAAIINFAYVLFYILNPERSAFYTGTTFACILVIFTIRADNATKTYRFIHSGYNDLKNIKLGILDIIGFIKKLVCILSN